jgi:putative peptidoglycan lipid II flippase
VLIKVLLPGFFAREDTRTPMKFAAISAGVNIAGSLSLFFVIGHVGIAIATSLAAWTNALLLGGTLLRRGHFEADALLRRRGALIPLTSVIMALALWAASFPLGRYFAPANGLAVQLPALVLLIAGGALFYLAVAQATGAANYRTLFRSIARG